VVIVVFGSEIAFNPSQGVAGAAAATIAAIIKVPII
jgi:hypothetical protein